MECPICGLSSPADPETGYNAPDVCISCAKLGWTYDSHGNLIHEREPEPVSEYDQIRR